MHAGVTKGCGVVHRGGGPADLLVLSAESHARYHARCASARAEARRPFSSRPAAVRPTVCERPDAIERSVRTVTGYTLGCDPMTRSI